MTRLAFVDHRNRMCFFISPKCGSSSLFDWLMKTALDEQPDRRKDQLVKKVFGYSFVAAAKLVTHQGYFAVGFIRHPARRVVSAFADKVVSNQLAAKNVIGKHSNVPAEDVSGFSFNELLDSIAAMNKSGKSGRVHRHFKPQLHPRHTDFGLQFDLVCDVASLSQDFEPVNRFYGSSEPIVRANARPRLAQPSGIAGLADKKSFELDKIDFHATDLLTAETLEKIARLYAIDYEAYGYDPIALEKPPAIQRDFNGVLNHKTLENHIQSRKPTGVIQRIKDWIS